MSKGNKNLLYNKTLYTIEPLRDDYNFPDDFKKIESFSKDFVIIEAYKGRLFLVSNNGTYFYDVKNASLNIFVDSKSRMSEFHNGKALLFANDTLYGVSNKSIVKVGKINLENFNVSEFQKLFYIEELGCRKEYFRESRNVFWSPRGWLIYNGSSLYFFNRTLKKVLDNASWIRWIGWDGEGFILVGNETVLEFDGQKIKNLTPKFKEFLGITSPSSSSAQTLSFRDNILILIVLLFTLMGFYLIKKKG